MTIILTESIDQLCQIEHLLGDDNPHGNPIILLTVALPTVMAVAWLDLHYLMTTEGMCP